MLFPHNPVYIYYFRIALKDAISEKVMDLKQEYINLFGTLGTKYSRTAAHISMFSFRKEGEFEESIADELQGILSKIESFEVQTSKIVLWPTALHVDVQSPKIHSVYREVRNHLLLNWKVPASQIKPSFIPHITIVGFENRVIPISVKNYYKDMRVEAKFVISEVSLLRTKFSEEQISQGANPFQRVVVKDFKLG